MKGHWKIWALAFLQLSIGAWRWPLSLWGPGAVALALLAQAPPHLPSTWHRDPGEGLRLAQRVHLDVPEGLAHGALQVPATRGAGETPQGAGPGSLWDRHWGCGPVPILALPGMGPKPQSAHLRAEPSCEGKTVRPPEAGLGPPRVHGRVGGGRAGILPPCE